uniref:Uncharacterized protein n=1 Tax=Macaca fascicularis TaxID=9541 RepID=Q9GLY7_MACFA|nr:hypothetical protein [Macaca fascicularis]
MLIHQKRLSLPVSPGPRAESVSATEIQSWEPSRSSATLSKPCSRWRGDRWVMDVGFQGRCSRWFRALRGRYSSADVSAGHASPGAAEAGAARLCTTGPPPSPLSPVCPAAAVRAQINYLHL